MQEMEKVHCEGSVVWYQLASPRVYKGIWWPCKVVSAKDGDDAITLKSFFDHCIYEIDIDSLRHGQKLVQPFCCSEKLLKEFVSLGKQRFKKRTSTLKEFLGAVTQALDDYNSNNDDSTFTLDLDCSDLSSSLNSTPSNLATPPHLVLSSSVFTTGATTSLRKTRSSTNKRPRPNYCNEHVEDPLKPVNLETRRSAIKRQKQSKSEYNSDGVGARLRFNDAEETENDSDGVGARLLRYDHSETSEENSNSDNNDSFYQPDNLTSQDISLSSKPSIISISSDSQNGSPDNQNRSPDTDRSLTPSPREHVIISPQKITKKLSVEIARLSATPVRVQTVTVGDTTSCVSTGYIETTPPTPPTSDKTNNHPQASSSHETNTDEVPSLSVDSFMQPGYDTMLEQIRDFSSDDEDDDNDPVSSDPDSDDDLPIVDFSVQENVRIHEIRPNAVIWTKYKHYPFWPVLVVSVKKSKKIAQSSLQVKFLGYEVKEPKVKIKNHKNIALYATKRATQFKEEGGRGKNSKRFFQAVEDAETLIRLRADKEIRGNPEEQLQQIITYRPRRQESRSVSPVVEASHTPFMADEVNTDAPLNIDSAMPDSSDEEFDIPSSEGEEDNQEFEYNHTKVMEIVNKIECELVAIAQGRAESRRHSVFVSGSEKERNGLKKEGHYGPLMKWKSGKRFDFSQHLLKMVGKPEHQPVQCKLSQDYLLGVLLPETMTRMIMRMEGVSYQEAEQQL
ncbi:uncharacterized protein LOC135338070 isoform X2 [Halichondria panicea]|uniref:uncharacterized protein LOC135338070 isoform X2 n=1 Tax=Halichondria panicea TaxID=6063 RepID=UPI00312B40FA